MFWHSRSRSGVMQSRREIPMVMVLTSRFSDMTIWLVSRISVMSSMGIKSCASC